MKRDRIFIARPNNASGKYEGIIKSLLKAIFSMGLLEDEYLIL